jgi:hypothetical protein
MTNLKIQESEDHIDCDVEPVAAGSTDGRREN